MRTSKPLLLAIPAMLLGIGTTELTAFGRAGSATLIGHGFEPGVCSIEPPAELLALADWPLDKTGCASGKAAKPPVLEARIRSVSDILASGGADDGEFSGMARGRAPVVSAAVVPVENILAEPADALAFAIAAPSQIEEASIGPLGEFAATRSASTGTSARGTGANEAGRSTPTVHDILAAGQSLGETRLQHVARDARYGDLGGTPARDRDDQDFALPPALLASAAVDAAELDSLRGGFTLPSGLQLSIGIERVVMINGVLQSTTVLRVVDAGSINVTPPTITAPTAPTITAPTAPTITAPTAPTITAPTAPTITAPTAATITAPTAATITPPAAPAIAPPAAPVITPPTAPVITPPAGPAVAAPATPSITPPTAPAITPPTVPVVAAPAAPTITSPTSPSAPVLVLQPGGNAVSSLPAGTTVAVIQNGPNNAVTTALNSASLATVVQNSLDNQKVQVITTVDAKVNSAEVLHGIRLQQSLQEALNRSSMQR